MQQLELHYRVVKLKASECSASMARTYDVEVWFPAEQMYKEVSSISNARTYQARRSNTRYKDEHGKIQYVHTLNASGLATSRLFAAILEQNQLEDGMVNIPKVLIPWVGTDKIE
jgi:seryl-tRNA synthetase